MINDLYISLEILWKGMAGLYIVCISIMLIIMLCAKLLNSGKKE
jgi:hypothetical protein